MYDLMTGRALGAKRCLEPFGSVRIGCCCGIRIGSATRINSPLVGIILVHEETDIRVGCRNAGKLGCCLSFGGEAFFAIWLIASVEVP